MSYKNSVELKDLEGFEKVKDCYYYNSKTNSLYTKYPRNGGECRDSVGNTIRDTEGKSILIDLDKVKIAFLAYTQKRREAKTERSCL